MAGVLQLFGTVHDCMSTIIIISLTFAITAAVSRSAPECVTLSSHLCIEAISAHKNWSCSMLYA